MRYLITDMIDTAIAVVATALAVYFVFRLLGQAVKEVNKKK